MIPKRVYIYALIDSGGIRYIGKADDVIKRFKAHFWEAYNKNGKEYNLPKSRWIRKHAKNIFYILLEECNENNWSEIEQQWIEFYKPKTKLLNLAKGGFGGSGLKSIITRDKIRQKALGRKASIETKNKMSLTRTGKKINLDVKGKNNPNARPIYQFSISGDFIKMWDTSKDAAEYYKISKTSISQNLCGRSKTCVGFIWKYNK